MYCDWINKEDRFVKSTFFLFAARPCRWAVRSALAAVRASASPRRLSSATESHGTRAASCEYKSWVVQNFRLGRQCTRTDRKTQSASGYSKPTGVKSPHLSMTHISD